MTGLPLRLHGRTGASARVLWAVDVAAWALIVTCGVVVVLGHSTSVQHELAGAPWLVTAFAAFWMLGGCAGLVTRLFRLGIAEVPAIAATLTALATYELLLAHAIAHGFPFGLMPFLVPVVMAALVGRWIALHDLGRRHPRPPGR